jgi:hypothetical protein
MIENIFQSKVGMWCQRAINFGKVEEVRVLQSNIEALVPEVHIIWDAVHNDAETYLVRKPAIEVQYPDGTKKFMPWESQNGTMPPVGTIFEFGKMFTLWPPPVSKSPR